MDGIRVGFGEIVNEMAVVARENSALLAVTVLGIVAGYSLLDLLDSKASNAINFGVTIFLQYQIVERLLADRLSGEQRKHRYGAMFIAGLLGGLATLVGFVLLVVPGLWLMAGWSASTPFIVIEDKTGTAALGASWRATAASRAPIVLVLLVGSLFMAGGLAGLMLFAGVTGEATSLPATIYINLLGSVVTVAGWVLGAAVYRLVVPYGGAFQEVFA